MAETLTKPEDQAAVSSGETLAAELQVILAAEAAVEPGPVNKAGLTMESLNEASRDVGARLYEHGNLAGGDTAAFSESQATMLEGMRSPAESVVVLNHLILPETQGFSAEPSPALDRYLKAFTAEDKQALVDAGLPSVAKVVDMYQSELSRAGESVANQLERDSELIELQRRMETEAAAVPYDLMILAQDPEMAKIAFELKDKTRGVALALEPARATAAIDSLVVLRSQLEGGDLQKAAFMGTDVIESTRKRAGVAEAIALAERVPGQMDVGTMKAVLELNDSLAQRDPMIEQRGPYIDPNTFEIRLNTDNLIPSVRQYLERTQLPVGVAALDEEMLTKIFVGMELIPDSVNERDWRLLMESARSGLTDVADHHEVTEMRWGQKLALKPVDNEELAGIIGSQDSRKLYGVVAAQTDVWSVRRDRDAPPSEIDVRQLVGQAHQAATGITNAELRALAHMEVFDAYLDRNYGDIGAAQVILDSGELPPALRAAAERALAERRLDEETATVRHERLAKEILAHSETNYTAEVTEFISSKLSGRSTELNSLTAESAESIAVSINMPWLTVFAALRGSGRLKTFHDSGAGVEGKGGVRRVDSIAFQEYHVARTRYEEVSGIEARGTSYDMHAISGAVASSESELAEGAASTYGDAAIFLRSDRIKDRTIFSFGDSLDRNLWSGGGSGQNNPKFLNWEDASKAKTVLEAARQDLPNVELSDLPYIEAQVLGGVAIDDIERVVLPDALPENVLDSLRSEFPSITFKRHMDTRTRITA